MPKCAQFIFQGKLFTPKLHRNFKTVCMKVIKIRHSYKKKKKKKHRIAKDSFKM